MLDSMARVQGIVPSLAERVLPERIRDIDAANQAAILSGKTFRSRRPNGWRVGKSPSDHGDRS